MKFCKYLAIIISFYLINILNPTSSRFGWPQDGENSTKPGTSSTILSNICALNNQVREIAERTIDLNSPVDYLLDTFDGEPKSFDPNQPHYKLKFSGIDIPVSITQHESEIELEIKSIIPGKTGDDALHFHFDLITDITATITKRKRLVRGTWLLY